MNHSTFSWPGFFLFQGLLSGSATELPSPGSTRILFLAYSDFFFNLLDSLCSELNSILNILVEVLRREEAHRSSRMGYVSLMTYFLSSLSECFWKTGPFFCLMCVAYHSIWHSGHSHYLFWLKWYIHVSCSKA